MKRLFALVFLLLTAATPFKENQAPQPPWYFNFPFRGQITVIYLPADLVHAACIRGMDKDKVPFGARIRACAFTYEEINACEIVMPFKNGTYPDLVWESILRHEMGHCNGWNGDHNN